MGIVTVRELLAVLPDTPIYAGEGGLDNPISTVSFLDAPSSVDWLNGGELILTTAFLYKENMEMQAAFVQKLIEMNVVALGIKIGRYIEEIPPQAIAYANEKNFPIFGISYDTVWSEVFSAFHTLQLNEKGARSFLNTEMIAFDKLFRSSSWRPEVIQSNFLRCIKLPAVIVDDNYNILCRSEVQAIDELEAYCERRGKYHTESDSPESFVSQSKRMEKIFDAALYSGERLVLHLTNNDNIRRDEMAWVASLYESIRKKNRFMLDTSALWKNFITEYIVGGLDEYFKDYAQMLDLNRNIIGTLMVFAGQSAATARDEFTRMMRTAVNQKEALLHDVEIGDEIVVIYAKTTLEVSGAFSIEMREVMKKLVRKCDGFQVWVGEPVESMKKFKKIYSKINTIRKISAILLPDEDIVFYSDLSVIERLRKVDFDFSEINFLHEQITSFDACKTLEMYLESGNIKRAAERLFIHDNTMRYRIDKVEECLNMDLSKPLDRVNLLLKIKLWRIAEVDELKERL